MNARGQVESSTRGNLAQSDYTYNPETGRIEKQLTVHNSFSNPIQEIDYTWDDIGNLTTRANNSGRGTAGFTNAPLEESFCYDDLNRITGVDLSLSGSCGAPQMRYNSIGNITYKHDVGNYTYDEINAGPHAVTKTSIGNISYDYDANGNLTSDGTGRSINYTVFDKPDEIRLGDNTTKFYYGPDRERWKRVDSNSSTGEITTTLYLGSVEKVYNTTATTTTTEWQRYLGAFALFSDKTKTIGSRTIHSIEKQYLYKNYQGSIDAITDETGKIITVLSFDVWGSRRDGYDGTSISLEELTAIFDQKLSIVVPTYSITTKGYTGHEMLDEVGLIHMNGRVYNPTIARFVSADPLISYPDDTQNYNRYSYVHNRPMFYTDPSGFESANDERFEEHLADTLIEIGNMTCNCSVNLGSSLSEGLSDKRESHQNMKAIEQKVNGGMANITAGVVDAMYNLTANSLVNNQASTGIDSNLTGSLLAEYRNNTYDINGKFTGSQVYCDDVCISSPPISDYHRGSTFSPSQYDMNTYAMNEHRLGGQEQAATVLSVIASVVPIGKAAPYVTKAVKPLVVPTAKATNKYIIKPFVKFLNPYIKGYKNLKPSQKSTCIGAFMLGCGPGGLADKFIKDQLPYAPRPVGPSQYEGAFSHIQRIEKGVSQARKGISN